MIGRKLDDKVSVSPQIAVEDVETLRDTGVVTIICNRPDEEVTEDLSMATIGGAAKASGLSFEQLPLSPGMLTLDLISSHLNAIDAADGPVLAYCASGTRSAFLWAFSMAYGNRLSNEVILRALDEAGYPNPALESQLDQVRQLGGSQG